MLKEEIVLTITSLERESKSIAMICININRLSSTNVINRVFRYVPRNRIVTNTFKIRSEERPVYYTQAQNVTVTTSASSLGNYPSLTLSHDGDSLLADPYSSLTDQVINNQPRSMVFNEMQAKNPEFR